MKIPSFLSRFRRNPKARIFPTPKNLLPLNAFLCTGHECDRRLECLRFRSLMEYSGWAEVDPLDEPSEGFLGAPKEIEGTDGNGLTVNLFFPVDPETCRYFGEVE